MRVSPVSPRQLARCIALLIAFGCTATGPGGGSDAGSPSVSAAAAPGPRPGELRLTQLDVGQGDAALIVTPEGKRLLIDAGPSPSQLLDELRRRHIDTIDLVVASHAHADHIGGMAAVLTGVTVRAYMDNGVAATTATYRNTLRALERSGARYLSATERTISLGSLTVRVLPPSSAFHDQNNTSVGLLLEFGNFRALYTGDSELGELGWWLSGRLIPPVTVVKVAHHGSRNGTDEGWARATHPAIALISVGRNDYGHPSIRTSETWEHAGATVYRTDRDGTVVIDAARDGRVHVTTTRASAVTRAVP
ncbi:MAG: MBL fold metallo-hydrolase [Gemmatimonadota bacterium]|nr:MBL fold metallo-hydrolase [Gemmatimonadota bacterium]